MRNIVFLPIELIKQAEEENWLLSVSYFVRLKSVYQNNTHYNFSLRSLAKKIKCSPACLSFHLKVLEAKGLVNYHCGNVTFSGLKKMQAKFGLKNMPVPVDLKHQKIFLRSLIIKFNLTAQEYIIKKSGIQKWQKGYVPFTKDEKINSSYVGLSGHGIGKLFNRSASTGARLRKRMKDLQIFSVTPVFSILFSNVSLLDFKNMRNEFIIPSYSFFRDGKIIVQRRTAMEYIFKSPIKP